MQGLCSPTHYTGLSSQGDRGCPCSPFSETWFPAYPVLGNLEVIEEGRSVRPQPLPPLSVCVESAALRCSEFTERGFLQRPARRLHRPQRGSGKAAAECRLGLSWPQRLGCRCPLSLPASSSRKLRGHKKSRGQTGPALGQRLLTCARIGSSGLISGCRRRAVPERWEPRLSGRSPA